MEIYIAYIACILNFTGGIWSRRAVWILGLALEDKLEATTKVKRAAAAWARSADLQTLETVRSINGFNLWIYRSRFYSLKLYWYIYINGGLCGFSMSLLIYLWGAFPAILVDSWELRPEYRGTFAGRHVCFQEMSVAERVDSRLVRGSCGVVSLRCEPWCWHKTNFWVAFLDPSLSERDSTLWWTNIAMENGHL